MTRCAGGECGKKDLGSVDELQGTDGEFELARCAEQAGEGSVDPDGVDPGGEPGGLVQWAGVCELQELGARCRVLRGGVGKVFQRLSGEGWKDFEERGSR